MDNIGTDIRLKNGKRATVAKVDDKYYFFNVKMTTFQLALIVFIAVLSILVYILLFNFIGEGFNRILEEIHTLQLAESGYMFISE